ncbi:MAG: CBS domain-containing protein [Proteobacteria bacterium]|nr:CBS domain-containing protein [Pseudomonadota bacterium]MBU1716607.1 CBS domain-containing protein [Pseudomonadota bacterium]
MVFSKKQNGQASSPEMVVKFLENTMPFNELDHEMIRDLARHCRVDFFPKGTRLLTAGETELTHLYLIQRGGVKSFITDDEGDVTLKDYRGEGSCIGALGIIRGALANLDVETVEDTFCFLLPRQIFLELIDQQPVVAQYYLKSFSEKIVHTAYSELRHHRVSRRSSEDLYLFSVTAGDIIKQGPWKISSTAIIQQAAAEMTGHRVGSLLVHDPDDPENIIGIITDKDLRTKVVAAGLAYSAPVSEIMNSPVRRVLSKAICFEVLLQMMAMGIHHLAVEQGGRIVGVITSHDIMLLQGHSPYYLFKEIVAQQEFGGLYPLSEKIPDVVRSLIQEGGKAGNITRMIAVLNDHILDRMLTLLEQEIGPPPVRYCWLLLGSEGRREQTFKTDQDNAIVYADPKDEAQRIEARSYFAELARLAIDHLVKCGYPLCPGEIMATNPLWCQPYSVWAGYFDKWIAAPDPKELLNVSIFFDFRCGYGDATLADDLRNHLISQTRRHEIYLLHLARDCMASRAPLSFFKNIIVEKNGEHKNKLDVKHQGLTPFVGFGRVMALKYGVKETNTLARLQVLSEEGHISQELWSAASNAYELQMHLRLIHQLRKIEQGEPPDNYIDPAQLTELDKRMLKEAFGVIERLHGLLANIFPLM